MDDGTGMGVCAALAVLGGVYLLLTRQAQDPGRRYLALSMFGGAASLGLQLPWLAADFDRTVRVPDLAALLDALGFVTTGEMVLLWVIATTPDIWDAAGGEGAARRLKSAASAVTGAICGVLTVLFAVGRHPVERPTAFSETFLDAPSIAFSVIYLSAFTSIWPVAISACRKAARALTGPELRIVRYGVLMEGTGWWFALVFALCGDCLVLVRLAGWPGAERWILLAAPANAMAAAMCSFIAVTCNLWGPRLDTKLAPRREAHAAQDARIRHRMLTGLYRSVADQVETSPLPDGVLTATPPQNADLATLERAAAYAAVRLADAYRDLSDHADPDVYIMAWAAARAAGYTPHEARTLAEACVLLAAANAKRAGRQLSGPARLAVPDPYRSGPRLLAVAAAAEHVDSAGRMLPDRHRATRYVRRLRRLPATVRHPRAQRDEPREFLSGILAPALNTARQPANAS